jgi:hypothetical protein
MVTTHTNTDKKVEIDFDVLNNYEDIIPDRMFDVDDVAG